MAYPFRKFFAAAAFLFVAGGLFAQSPQTLRFGSWVSGTIKPGSEDWFRISPAESGIMTLETTGGTDTYLELYDSSQTFLKDDDDGGNGSNAKLEYFIDAGAAYLIKVRGFDEEESGPYRFLASFEALPPDARNTTRARALSIRVGEPVLGFFRTASESRWYSLTVPPGGGQLVVYTEGSLDTTLSIYNSQNNLIAEGDDHNEDLNAWAAVIVSSGTIYIEAAEYGDSQGRYTLHTQLREAPKPDRYENDNSILNARDIRAGESQERTFTTASDIDWLRLRITQAGEYEIRIRAAGTMDSYLELYDADEDLIDEDDDSGGDYDPLITVRLNPGTYYIKAYTISDDPLDDNRYTLSVTRR